MPRFKAFAPATIANLGVGFDVLGLAVADLGDIVIAEQSDTPGVEIVDIIGDGGRLTRDPKYNTCAVAAQAVMNILGEEQAGVRLWLEKRLPLASGLGSSAASAVAAAMATNAVFGEPLHKEELLPAAIDAEAAVSGRHADNVAPSLLGGIILITGMTPGEIHRLPVPEGLYISLVTPGIEVPTALARSVLPKVVPLEVVVYQTGVIAELIHALHMRNIQLLARAMQRDAIVEEPRKVLIPHFDAMRELAARSGALVTVISGSGPTLCSLCTTQHEAEAVNEALTTAYQQAGIASQSYVTQPSLQGAYQMEN